MKLKTSAVFWSALLLIGLFSVCAAAQNIQRSQLFVVNDTADTNDANPGDTFCLDAAGKCTLRAAVQEANTTSLLDAVMFSLPANSTISLTLGEIQISKNIYIAGPGARKLTISRNGETGFRIFHVLANAGDNIHFRGLKITGGTNAGGAVYVETGNMVYVKESFITENPSGIGGGILNEGTLNLSRSLISSNGRNGQSYYGGGLYNSPNATATIIYCTFTGNTAGSGGGIYNEGSIKIANSTFYLNRAGAAGANIINNSLSPSVSVINTIIGKKGDLNPISRSLAGNFTSIGSNIVTDATDSTGFTNGVNNDQVSIGDTLDPLLAPLADNGGQTDTFALLAESPALNRGNVCVTDGSCPPFTPIVIKSDQRAGFQRSFLNPIDIGAYEHDMLPGGRSSLRVSSFNLRAAGCLEILTSAGTGEQQIRVSNQFGGKAYPDLLSGDAYIFETRCKRARINTGDTLYVSDLF